MFLILLNGGEEGTKCIILFHFLKCFGVPGGQMEQMQALDKDSDDEVRNSVLTVL
jgi:hypothetical protein